MLFASLNTAPEHGCAGGGRRPSRNQVQDGIPAGAVARMSAGRRNSTVESQPPIGSEQQRFPRSESSEKPGGRAIAIFRGSYARNRQSVAPQIRPIPIRRWPAII